MSMSENKTYGVPALLSFFIPGLGQLIKGELFKAIGIWVVLVISAILQFILIGYLIGFIVWIWQIYDAYNN
jgi:TM2 domain-containing membrane protein YozV